MGEVSPPCGARVHFLCLPKENEPKEKAPRQMRPSGSLRGSGDSLTGLPWPDSELADFLSATLRAFSSTPPPHLKGPSGALRHPLREPCGFNAQQKQSAPVSAGALCCLHCDEPVFRFASAQASLVAAAGCFSAWRRSTRNFKRSMLAIDSRCA